MKKSYSAVLHRRYLSWRELESEIEKLPTTKAEGDAFEEFTYVYFCLNKQKYQISEIYMSTDIPQKYRDKYKLGSAQKHDSGVDGLISTTEGKSIAYKGKFRTGRQKPSYEELTKFWSDGRYCDYCCTVANTYAITELSDKYEKNIKVLVQDLDALSEDFFTELLAYVTEEKVDRVFYSPHEYQKKIINDVIEGFSVEDRGKLIAACGTGKTLTALWIVEQMEINSVLFLAPSITLVKQTLESWAGQYKKPFNYICVCSDQTVSSSIEDSADIDVASLGIPVTTDETEIAAFLSADNATRKYVFSTYQSADKIVNAQHSVGGCFDLVICDEAHRTAGLKTSVFSLALDDQYIRSKKRLFMTATERLVRPMLMRRLEEDGKEVFSMDDEAKYGPLLSRYNFGDAIKDKTISDYKIVVAGVKESDVYNYIATNTHLEFQDIDEEKKIEVAQILYAKVLLAKCFSEYPIHKVISFHSSIDKASNFITGADGSTPLFNILKEFNPHLNSDNTYAETISSRVNAGDRSRIIETFKGSENAVLTNAKCLTEGVDVPIIDSVFFVDKKKSIIDIVQACGRALRTKYGVEKTSYFIIPILIPESSAGTDVLYSEEFDTVYNVIQALRDQDNRLAEWIDRLNNKVVTGSRIGAGSDDDPVEIDIEGVDIEQFSEQLYTRIATVNANPSFKQAQSFGPGDRRSNQVRIFKTMGDMTFKSYMSSNVDPTIEKYKAAHKKTLSTSEIRISHNNISHAKKLGLIDKSGSDYTLTELGQRYVSGKIDAKTLFRRQLLRYSCSMEDGAVDRVIFPYRSFLEILSSLCKEDKKEVLISFYEFAFCIYPMYDSSAKSVNRAIQDIHYLRAKYPRLDFVNDTNKEDLIEKLNKYFDTQYSVTDIWGSVATTVYNQYVYFRDHLSLFEEVIEIKNKKICMKANSSTKVEELLNLDKKITLLDKHHIVAEYTKAFLSLVLFMI